MDHGDMPPMPMTPDSMYNNSMVMMHLSFFWGKDVTVLFEGWPNDRLGMYVLALIFVFFLALAVEVLSAALSLSPAAARPSPAVNAAVYAVRVALAYMVMLSVMSFNLGIFIVAVAGHAVGYFLVKFRQVVVALGGAGPTSSIEYPKL